MTNPSDFLQDRVEVEIKKNGKRIFYVEYYGDPNDTDWVPDFGPVTTVAHGSRHILQEAAFYAGLVEAGK